MALSDQTIQSVKSVSLIEIIGKYVQLKRHGSEWRGKCPFHDEKTPSFYVHPDKGYKCFGCDASGADGIAFVMAYEKKTFPDAVIHVAYMSGIQIEQGKVNHISPKPIVKRKDIAPKRISYIPIEIFKNSLKDFEQNRFLKFIIGLFGPEVTNKLIEDYYIGSHDKWPGATVFWQIDSLGRIRTGKIMLYNPNTGKRVKNPCNHFDFIHKGLNEPEFALKQCFFGEHLLRNNKKPVAIVESEKTAIIASAYFQNMIWLASGGLMNLNIEKCMVLSGRNIIFYPDLNGFEEWENKAIELNKAIPGIKIKVSSLLNDMATCEERSEKLDLADYLSKINFYEYQNRNNREENELNEAVSNCEKWLFVNPNGGIFEFNGQKYSFVKK